MPWNVVTVVVSWLIMLVLIGVPTILGLLALNVTGFLLGLILGGIFLYICSDKLASYIRSGYTKTN